MKHFKKKHSDSMRLSAYIFSMQQCLVVPYIHSANEACYDIKPVRKEEGKSYWKFPLCDDDATREK